MKKNSLKPIKYMLSYVVDSNYIYKNSKYTDEYFYLPDESSFFKNVAEISFPYESEFKNYIPSKFNPFVINNIEYTIYTINTDEGNREDLGIVDYVKVFRYSLQRIRYEEKKDLRFRPFTALNISNLVGTDLSGLYLPRVDLFKSDLSGADLSGADLSEAKLAGTNLSEADLSGANLSNANLSNANLSNANLSNANLSNADLSGAILFETDLSAAILFETDLSGAELAETNFTNAKINNVTGFSNTRNLKHAINLIIPNPKKAFINAKKKTKKKSNKTKIGRRNIK